jgi:polysaccharide biosynthesis/export protein
MIFTRIRYFEIILLSVVCAFSSCITSKEIKYLQGDKNASDAKYAPVKVEYLVQSGDNLYVKISSTEDLTNQVLSYGNNGNMSQGLESKYKDVYLVNSEGYIQLPQLDKIKVEGKSIEKIKDTIDLCIQRFYSQTSCQVRLADNYLTILGDVNKPGRYLFDFRDKITLFELIGMAGDLSFEAKRSNIKLIRKKGLDTEIIELDLTKRKILGSEYYYLMPNDVVYVEPLKAISWHTRSFPFATSLALILSTTTSILVIISYLK